jgi:hypothetical protein
VLFSGTSVFSSITQAEHAQSLAQGSVRQRPQFRRSRCRSAYPALDCPSRSSSSFAIASAGTPPLGCKTLALISRMSPVLVFHGPIFDFPSHSKARYKGRLCYPMRHDLCVRSMGFFSQVVDVHSPHVPFLAGCVTVISWCVSIQSPLQLRLAWVHKFSVCLKKQSIPVNTQASMKESWMLLSLQPSTFQKICSVATPAAQPSLFQTLLRSPPVPAEKLQAICSAG